MVTSLHVAIRNEQCAAHSCPTINAVILQPRTRVSTSSTASTCKCSTHSCIRKGRPRYQGTPTSNVERVMVALVVRILHIAWQGGQSDNCLHLHRLHSTHVCKIREGSEATILNLHQAVVHFNSSHEAMDNCTMHEQRGIETKHSLRRRTVR